MPSVSTRNSVRPERSRPKFGCSTQQVVDRNGLAKFSVPQPVFGINDLRLGEMPYFDAKHTSLGTVVQLLMQPVYGQDCDGLDHGRTV
jgi:hypothetical protein